MRSVWKCIGWLAGLLLLVSSCKKAAYKQLEPKPDKYYQDSLFNPPSYFPPPRYDFSQNQLSRKKVELGKMLFYDPILSGDSTVACANCHQPFAAFAHLSHPVSHGIRRQFGNRNTPGLYNLAWMPDFMLDGGIVHLDVQSIAPISNPVEMGSSLRDALKTLNAHPVYRQKFKEAWEVNEIGSEEFLKSLSQFMLTIISSNSRYDMYKQGKAQLTESELKGLEIVQQKCTPCHSGELFTDFSFRNIGLDSTAGDPSDLGRENITRQKQDRRKFRVPSLRNVNITSPYFHSGTVFGLAAVLDRHDGLVNDNPNLDPVMRRSGTPGIRLSQQERIQILDFLKTLTDNTLSTNPAFKTPFDHYNDIH